MDATLEFQKFIANNRNELTEELVDDYVDRNKNKENENELMLLGLNEKALLARSQNNFNSALEYYLQIRSIKSLNKYQRNLNLLNIAQMMIALKNYEEVLLQINDYFINNDNPDYVISFELICLYVKTLKDGQNNIYSSQLNEILDHFKFEGKIDLHSPSEIIKLRNQYSRDNNSLSQLITIQNFSKKKAGLTSFIRNTQFGSLREIANHHLK